MAKGRVYLDVREHVNRYSYRIHNVPATYGPVQAYFLRKDSPGPLYVPSAREHYSCDYTIADMVDMHFNKVYFSFDNTDQMKEIYRILESYIRTMQEETNIDLYTREEKEYFQRAVNFRNSLTPRIATILKMEEKRNGNKKTFFNAVKASQEPLKRRMR